MADSLQPGDVFLSITPELSGDNPHFHIVVIKTVADYVLVVHTTKEIEKTRQRCQKKEKIKFVHIDPDTMIVINSSHCDDLSIESAIDCNKAILKHQDYFTTKQYYKKCKPIKVLTVIDKIKQAIKSSPVIEDVIKNLL